jgi:hypothetical protein
LAKTPILLAKAFPTGLARSCWESTIGVLSDGKELFANRNAGPVGKALPTATCSVDEGRTPSTRLSFPSPTGLQWLLVKASPTVSQSCWQRITRQGFSNSMSWLLAKPLDKVVGKGTLLAKLACFAREKALLCQQLCPMLGNNFFPFLLLLSCL